MNNIDVMALIAEAIKYFIPFLFALCFHEFAHGWVARLKGDRTAEMMGRLTMNPMAHIDFWGTIVLPLSAIFFHLPFFGWAKPVPVDSRNLRHPKEDMFWIALAGPLSNLLLGLVGAVLLVLTLSIGGLSVSRDLIDMIQIFIIINLFLAAFNLIPLHPLDGAKVLARFLPHRWNAWLEDNQATAGIILIALFLLGGFQFLAGPVYWTAQGLITLSAHFVHFLA